MILNRGSIEIILFEPFAPLRSSSSALSTIDDRDRSRISLKITRTSRKENIKDDRIILLIVNNECLQWIRLAIKTVIFEKPV